MPIIVIQLTVTDVVDVQLVILIDWSIIMKLIVTIYILQLHLYCNRAFHSISSGTIRRKSLFNSSFHPESRLNIQTNSRAFYDPNTATPVDSMNSVDQTLRQLGEVGSVLLNYSFTSLLFRSFAAGNLHYNTIIFL